MLKERWQTLTAGLAGAGAGAEAAEAADGDRRPVAALIDALAPLCFQGADVLSFLQGYLTVDLDQLLDGAPRLAALTNLKGRVVATGWCQIRESDRLDWLIHADLIDPVRAFMARYLAFSKTALIEPVVDAIAVGTVDRQGLPSARLIASDAEFDALVATHRPAGAADWYLNCIEHGIVLIGPESTETYLPQMIGLVEAGAVDFDKGCYLGQEVVARAQHRGQVKRRLTRLSGADREIPPGTPLHTDAGKEAGAVLLCQPPLCLAVVRQPPETVYRVGDQRLLAVS